jgi:hypothetical protein
MGAPRKPRDNAKVVGPGARLWPALVSDPAGRYSRGSRGGRPPSEVRHRLAWVEGRFTDTLGGAAGAALDGPLVEPPNCAMVVGPGAPLRHGTGSDPAGLGSGGTSGYRPFRGPIGTLVRKRA